MLILALILGFYSYSIFFLGLLGLLRFEYILLDTVFFTFLTIYFFRKNLKIFSPHTFGETLRKLSHVSMVFALLIILQALVNLVGVFGPELSFDALWYHLTLPKLYLSQGAVYFIPGNLLYYSAMPQLTEMYYIAALALQGEELAKFIHFLFGILSCVVLYIFSVKILKKREAALLAVVVFYANLVVGWESITAFVDLTRTFFELMALVLFFSWIEKKKTALLLASGILLGFAISTKLLALGSLAIFVILICFVERRMKIAIKNVAIFVGVALLTVSPWLIFAFKNTGNPLYPFFSKLSLSSLSVTNSSPFTLAEEAWKVFVVGADPILPIYLIVLPLLFVVRKKISSQIKLLLIYVLLSFLIWSFLPKIGGGRFIMPYLPAYSLLVSFIIYAIKLPIRKLLISLVILLAFTSVLYRGVANAKYLPVIIGSQSKALFLKQNLNFAFGDYYDIDGYFEKQIKPNDTVLLYGFHNLYYVDFPFIDSTWVKKGDRYNYIAVQNGNLPEGVIAKPVYSNKITGITLYKTDGYQAYK